MDTNLSTQEFSIFAKLPPPASLDFLIWIGRSDRSLGFGFAPFETENMSLDRYRIVKWFFQLFIDCTYFGQCSGCGTIVASCGTCPNWGAKTRAARICLKYLFSSLMPVGQEETFSHHDQGGIDFNTGNIPDIPCL